MGSTCRLKSISGSFSVPDADFYAFIQRMNQAGFGDPSTEVFSDNFGFRVIADFVDGLR